MVYQERVLILNEAEQESFYGNPCLSLAWPSVVSHDGARCLDLL